MAYLPEGYADEIAKADVIIRGERARDGEYVFLHKKCDYTKTKAGPMLIIEHEVVSSVKTDPAIEPNAPGAMVSYMMPDYGDAAVMLKPNMKAYVCGLAGLDPKKTDQVELAKTIALVAGPQQLARGMYIKAKTFHTDKKNGEDFMGFNWSPVAGENHPVAPTVVKRRQELDAKAAVEAAAGPQAQPSQTSATAAPSLPMTGAPALPGAAPSLPADPLALLMQQGWAPHPGDPNYFWRGQELKTKQQLLAGQ